MQSYISHPLGLLFYHLINSFNQNLAILPLFSDLSLNDQKSRIKIKQIESQWLSEETTEMKKMLYAVQKNVDPSSIAINVKLQ